MKLLRRWGPVVLWMAIIFFFSTRQHIVVSSENVINFLFFKSLHIIEYAVLYVLTFRATKKTILSFLIVILYAISDEAHQLFVISREGRLRDVIIDAVGALLAWATLTNLLPKLPKKLQRTAKSLLKA